ncbi:inosine-uridine nucleoside n-ribohydrolase [Stylonychia lemnae]|uniref:Inosine-uridine nucleoside n-ribohydrolase n=1 Tax=Stylonychia lemnae TaxID=5949 RepID=A0A078AH44_STYLE|nr:inosine-uridine nucleoside n-ribohydrolase [Stylonychia lemnae]|eukprot:CDW81564.1 inosine-uridine nucleoside n-ribohydrolase [Stylonychia lemnae]
MEQSTKNLNEEDTSRHTNLNERPHKVIIDCDPGADDAHAIVLAHYLSKVHQVEILGITTVGCNHTIDQVTINTQIILETLKVNDIKIYKGFQKDDFKHIDYYFGVDGFGNYANEYIEQHGSLEDKHFDGSVNATQFIINSVKQFPQEITLLSIGGLTNIMRIYQEYPELPEMFREIVLMGGNIKGSGNAPNWCSEFNFYQDATAAKKFFEAFKNVTMVGYELCFEFFQSLSKEQQSQIFDQDTDLARMVKASYRNSYKIENERYCIYDQIAVACVFEPSIVKSSIYKQLKVLDESEAVRGAVIINWLDQLVTDETTKVKIITEIDRTLMRELLEESLKGYNEDIYKIAQQKKQENKVALQTYLEALGIPKFIKLRPNFETLCQVVNKHAQNIKYQNLHFHLRDRPVLSFEFKDMVERMVVQKLGGLCYEHCQLTYHVLNALGFNTKQLLAQILKNTELRFDPNVYFEHGIQIVNIDGQLYIVDDGFGAYSPKYPLPFNPKEQLQTYEFSEKDKYQILNNGDHFELQYYEGDHWRRGFGFSYPFQFKSPQEIQERYENHVARSKFSNIRDGYILFGKISQQMNTELAYMRRVEPFTAYIRYTSNDGYEKQMIQNYQDLIEIVKREFNFDLPSREVIRDNSDIQPEQ